MQQEKTEELYLPDNQVVRSEQLSSETSSSTENNPNGIPGLATNIDPNRNAVGRNAAASGFEKTDQTRNYEIGKMISRQIQPTGQLKQLSVAVIVDGSYETVTVGKGDKQRQETKYVPRNDEEMAKLVSIVKGAVNFDENRGDKVEVANIPFNTTQFDMAEEQPGVGKWIDAFRPFVGFFKYIAAAIFVIFTFMFVVKPLIRWLTDTSWEDVEILEHLPRSLAEIEQQYREGDASASAVGQAAQLLAANQNNTNQLMRQWMKES